MSKHSSGSRTSHGSKDQRPRYVPDPIDLSRIANVTSPDYETAFPNPQYSLSTDVSYYQPQRNIQEVQSRSTSHFNPPDADSSLSHGNWDHLASTMNPFGQPPSSTSPISSSNSTQELMGLTSMATNQLYSTVPMDVMDPQTMINSCDYSSGSPGASSFASFEAGQSPYQPYAETTLMDPSMATSEYFNAVASNTSSMDSDMYGSITNMNINNQALEGTYGQQSFRLAGSYQQMPPTPPESDRGSPLFAHPCTSYSSQLIDGSNGNSDVNGQSYNVSHSRYAVARSTGSLSAQSTSG